MIYFDNAATTKVDHDVGALISDLFINSYGNASSTHKYGNNYKMILNNSRKQVANLLQCNEDNIIFTSGATESNNAAIYSMLKKAVPEKKTVLVSKIEHPSILEAISYFSEQGAIDLDWINVDSEGIVDLEVLKSKMNSHILAVIIMAVNNETGVIQPFKEISNICKDYNAYFHCDYVQALGKLQFDKDLYDSASFSSHKIYGPKGIGALYIKKPYEYSPFIIGGGQQANLRAGTEAVELIAGFGLACEKLKKHYSVYNQKIQRLKDYLIHQFKTMDGVGFNAHKNTIPHINSIHVNGIRSDTLSLILEQNNIAISQGSACSSNHGGKHLSHVLTAMGIPEKKIRTSFRISFSMENTKDEIDYFCMVIKNSIEKYKVNW